MIIDIKQLEETRLKFLDFKDSIQAVSINSSDLFKTLEKSIETLSLSSSKILGSEDFQRAKNIYYQMYGSTGELTKTVEVARDRTKSFKNLASAAAQASRYFRDYEKPSKLAVFVFKQDEKEVEKGSGDSGILGKELDSFRAMAMSAGHKLMLPMPGEAFSTPIRWIIKGLLDLQQFEANAGELENILVTAFDGTSRSVVDKATQSMSDFQITIENFYGLSRKEYQETIATFVKSGVAIEDFSKTVQGGLGIVGSGTEKIAFALDKLFELANGTSARTMVELMTKFNKNIDQARESTIKLQFLGQQSGIGVEQFMKNVMLASNNLQDLGVEFDTVINLAYNLQKVLEDTDLKKQFSGKFIADGLQEVTSGIKNMKEEFLAMVAERMGMGTGLKAVYRLKDVMMNYMENTKNPEFLLDFVKAAYEFASEAGQGKEENIYRFLNESMGFGSRGSLLLIKAYNHIKLGKAGEAVKVARDIEDAIAGSLGVERKKANQFQLLFNQWLFYVGQMGRGILSMLTAYLSKGISFMGIFIPLLKSLATGDFEGFQKLYNKWDETTSRSIDAAKSEVLASLSGLKDTAKAFKDEALGKSLDSLSDAFTYGSGDSGKKSVDTAVPNVVYVPVGGGSAAIPTPVSSKPIVSGGFMTPAPKTATETVLPMGGGELRIVSTGVDVKGNIGLELKGNCPRCGLMFGGDSAIISQEKTPSRVSSTGDLTSKQELPSLSGSERSSLGISSMSGMGGRQFSELDVEAMSRMLQSEVQGQYKGREREVAAVAYTALNRMKNQKRSLYDVITGGQGFGKQGMAQKGMRPYATRLAPTKSTVDLAKKFLSGEIEDPTGGKGTSFYHTNPRTGVLGRKGANRAAFPKFAKSGGILFAEPSRGRQDKWVVVVGGEQDTDEGAKAREFLSSSFEGGE